MSKAEQYRHNLDKAKRQAKHEQEELDKNKLLLEMIRDKIIKGI